MRERCSARMRAGGDAQKGRNGSGQALEAFLMDEIKKGRSGGG